MYNERCDGKSNQSFTSSSTLSPPYLVWETVYLMFKVDLEPFAVNLATNGFEWAKSSPWIEYDCLGKSLHGSTLIDVGFTPVGAGVTGVVIGFFYL